MTEYKCEYCGKVFTTSSNLSKHKKTASFCLELQKTQFNVVPSVESYRCNDCQQSFGVKCNYQAHLVVCKVKKEREQTEEIERLQSEIHKLKLENTSALHTISEQRIKLVLYEKEIESYEKQMELIQKSLQEKNTEMERLYNQIREKDEHIRTHSSVTNIYQTTNNTNTKYEMIN